LIDKELIIININDSKKGFISNSGSS
jgi:hypothetical protein